MYFISIGILIHENLGLDTKITFLLQLEQKLWHIYRNKVWNWQPSWTFSCFLSFNTHNNGLPCCIMCLIWFLDQENIGLDPQIMTLHEVISEILKISDFEAAILKKWLKLVVSNSFFSGNITDMIPKSPLNKMVPLIEDHLGGGGMGTPVSSRTTVLTYQCIVFNETAFFYMPLTQDYGPCSGLNVPRECKYFIHCT